MKSGCPERIEKRRLEISEAQGEVIYYKGVYQLNTFTFNLSDLM